MDEENTCPQCGGMLKVRYWIEFDQCRPESLGWKPTFLPSTRLCPGHPTITEKSDWEELSAEQKHALDRVRDAIFHFIIDQTEEFYKEHSELQLMWQYTLDARIRGKADEWIQP